MARNKNPEVTVGRILDVALELFLQKGYENTTIQDIIDALGNLSKGAIYHHFKSKEDIVYAVIEKMYGDEKSKYAELLNSKQYSGKEKLRQMLLVAVNNPSQEFMVKSMPNLLKNPKFLAIHISTTIDEAAHNIIEAFIRTGIEDGSIQTDYPRELAEVIAVLVNVWVNPLVFSCTPVEMYRKCLFFKHISDKLEIGIIDDEVINRLKVLIDMRSE